jgi:hypothetical protein
MSVGGEKRRADALITHHGVITPRYAPILHCGELRLPVFSEWGDWQAYCTMVLRACNAYAALL